MREGILMRVLFCKFHCPFICFCKPSAASHLYNHGTLRLENVPNSSSLVVVSESETSAEQFSVETGEIKEEEESVVEEKQEVEIVLRSCVKKVSNGDSNPSGGIEKKRVQWLDNTGKELVEIREFESSETGDTDNEDEGRGCVCTIL